MRSPQAGCTKRSRGLTGEFGEPRYWGWTETLRQLSVYGVAALGLVIARPNVGFNPGESWGVVLERSFASRIMAERTTSDALRLPVDIVPSRRSSPPDNDRALTALVLLHGLTRIDDETGVST